MLRGFSITYLAELVSTNCIERREDRGRPRSAWTAANIVYLLAIWSADCTKAWQKVSRAWSTSEWWCYISNAFCKIVQIGGGILKTWAFECSGLSWFCKWKTELLMLSLGDATGIINLFNISLVNRCVQNITILKCTKNHANWFRHFKDIDSQM